MGCVQGRHADPGNGPPATITLGGYGGGRSIGDRRHQTMAPDPDLGWRRLPNSIATSMGGVATGAVCNDPTEWSSSLLSNESPRGPQQRMGGNVPSDGQSQQQQVLYPARHAWGVCFFNDRSGHFCNVSIVTLAINIAIRAEGLANTFGVVSDQCDTMLNSIERFAREGEEAPDSHHKIYAALRVPDAGWRLLRRRADEIPSSDGGIHGQLKDSSRRKGIANGRSAGKISNRETVDGRRVISQLIQRGATGEPVYADVPEIGMNIAEQLYRLERRQDNRHFLPTNSFGWRFSTEMEMEEEFRIAVSSPEGEAFWLVPEELIMNVTQWVQQTYLTSTAFP